MSLLKKLFGGFSMKAASQLPPASPPKVKSGSVAIPSYLSSAKPAATALPKTDRRLASTDTTSFRTGVDTKSIIRDFCAASPEMSSALFSYIRVGITNGYMAVAKNMDGTANPEATALLQQIIARMDVLPDYSEGFSGTWSLRSISESLAKEIITTGAMAGELVLGKTRLPARIQPISSTSIEFIPDNGILRPVQKVGGEEFDLDVPTFIYVALDQDLKDAYASSMMEPAVKAVIFAESFVQDLQRVARRAVHPRLFVKMVEEKIKNNMPPEAQHDNNKAVEWLNSVKAEVEDTINTLEPEEALVMYDSIDVDYLNNGNVSIGQEWKTLQDLINAKLSTGTKTMPAILGHGVGSQNVASTESMLFVKAATGAVLVKLNEFYSRMFTLAIRLFGQDVTVEFKYNDIDLRPESELEAFRSQKQSRILELLSLGMVSDEEACLQLTGKLPPNGYKPLMGTMFMSKKATADDNPNGETNSGSTLNQNLKSDAPTGSRGSNTKSSPTKADVLPIRIAE